MSLFIELSEKMVIHRILLKTKKRKILFFSMCVIYKNFEEGWWWKQNVRLYNTNIRKNSFIVSFTN